MAGLMRREPRREAADVYTGRQDSHQHILTLGFRQRNDVGTG